MSEIKCTKIKCVECSKIFILEKEYDVKEYANDGVCYNCLAIETVGSYCGFDTEEAHIQHLQSERLEFGMDDLINNY